MRSLKFYVAGGIVLLVLVIILVSLGGVKGKVAGTWESCGMLGCTTWIFKRDGTVRGIGIDDVEGHFSVVDRNHIEITWESGVVGGPRGVCEVETTAGMLILRCPTHTWDFERK